MPTDSPMLALESSAALSLWEEWPVLSDEERTLERLLLGLRLADGVPAGWLAADRVEDFVSEGLASRSNGTSRSAT